MEVVNKKAEINGFDCKGEANIIALKNRSDGRKFGWAGKFRINKKAFDEDWPNWKGNNVKYEGSFNFGGKTSKGIGPAIITEVSQSNNNNFVILNLNDSGEFGLNESVFN